MERIAVSEEEENRSGDRDGEPVFSRIAVLKLSVPTNSLPGRYCG
jgi:hypothetical protein